MTTPSAGELQHQFLRIRASGELVQIALAATNHAVPTGLFVAICSRETNCVNMLGDYQGGEHHGVGICQIDIQHDIARKARDSGSWKTAQGMAALLDFGAELLSANIRKARADFDDLTDDEVYRFAADGYNANMGRVEKDGEDGGDPDAHTTGHDYGKDVMARKAVFDRLLAGATE